LLLLFLQGMGLAFPSILSPSPLKIFLISRSLQNGWRSTLPAAFVSLATDGPIVVLMLFLLNQVPGWFLQLLRIGGGLFILYLSSKFFRALPQGGISLEPSPQAGQRTLREAIGINLLNPNPYLLWGVVGGPTVLAAMREQSTAVGLSFIIGFYLTFILGLVAIVILFGTVGKLSARLSYWLSVIAAVSLAVLGIYQIVVGAMAL
jgi:threonine/homoserine/homoserine lactone efflux protein